MDIDTNFSFFCATEFKLKPNTKIQRWAILLAEYGATISYRKGKHNIRADMLSRIPAEVAAIDVEEPFVLPPTDINEVPTPDQKDFQQDNINPVQLQSLQCKEFPELYIEANNDDSTYVTINVLLYNIALPSCRAPDYPRIVLPEELRHQVMFHAHKEAGHSSVPNPGKYYSSLCLSWHAAGHCYLYQEVLCLFNLFQTKKTCGNGGHADTSISNANNWT